MTCPVEPENKRYSSPFSLIIVIMFVVLSFPEGKGSKLGVKVFYEVFNFKCVYQAEPHQGFDKHVCPRMEKDSGRAGYWITILGQELLMHVRKKGKREKKSF